MTQASPLPWKVRALAALMRRMPTDIRKFASWWDRLYRSIGAGDYTDDPEIADRWPAGLHGPVSSRRFGYRVFLDLKSFAERRTYFSGAGSQQELEQLFPVLLRPGDQYVDIGANIGMIAMMASRLIGPRGVGYAFEPNPEIFNRLRSHFELNHVTNLTPLPYALSDADSDALLVVPAGASGCGSLAFGADTGGRSYSVQTRSTRPCLDWVDPARPLVIKIDAEGYEGRILRGAGDVLDHPDVAILAEVNPPLLRLAGDSPEDLLDLLARRGFRPFAFDVHRGRFGSTLRITEASRLTSSDDWSDFLFFKPDSAIYRERIEPRISRNSPVAVT